MFIIPPRRTRCCFSYSCGRRSLALAGVDVRGGLTHVRGHHHAGMTDCSRESKKIILLIRAMLPLGRIVMALIRSRCDACDVPTPLGNYNLARLAFRPGSRFAVIMNSYTSSEDFSKVDHTAKASRVTCQLLGDRF